jgi:hypothetical protein
MLRRWMQTYRDWDDRTYQRLSSGRWMPIVGLALFWACLLVLPWVVWQVRSMTGRLTPELVAISIACCLLGGVLGTIGFHRQLRRRLAEERRRAGLCERCGYDLRGSYYYCPECGQSLHW